MLPGAGWTLGPAVCKTTVPIPGSSGPAEEGRDRGSHPGAVPQEPCQRLSPLGEEKGSWLLAGGGQGRCSTAQCPGRPLREASSPECLV